eukprot:TRINITY_DN3152_c1_g1_i1.p1 TRINITY_DN3152_c1_g1~~TRINITY_DN3152_c1_g1_i1.p1  ORF type:complete len:466 (+),score=79.14 TRINITY_DN3152_c1_g1_i1:61-1458(+)
MTKHQIELDFGTLFHNRWLIFGLIGQGAFGSIYSATDLVSEQLVAIKFESTKVKHSVLFCEVYILHSMNGNPFFCEYITCGKDPNYRFVVMELLGPSINKLKRRQPKKMFSYKLTGAIGKLMVSSIESLHKAGFIHRDIKPSNFCIGNGSKSNRIYLIDFGLARPYLNKDNTLKEQKDVGGFRGTTRYASINSHDCRSLSRCDDLWSLFYVLIEISGTELPWHDITDRDEVAECKRKYMVDNTISNLPVQFSLFLEHLLSLKFEDCPDYEFLKDLMKELSLVNADDRATSSPSYDTISSTSVYHNLNRKQSSATVFSSSENGPDAKNTIEVLNPILEVDDDREMSVDVVCKDQEEFNDGNRKIDAYSSALDSVNLSISNYNAVEGNITPSLTVTNSNLVYNPSICLSSSGIDNELGLSQELGNDLNKFTKVSTPVVQCDGDPSVFFFPEKSKDDGNKCCCCCCVM